MKTLNEREMYYVSGAGKGKDKDSGGSSSGSGGTITVDSTQSDGGLRA